MAEYAALAAGDGGNLYSARAPTQAEANRQAVKDCNEQTGKKNCSVAVMKAVVIVADPKAGAVGYFPATGSIQEAKDRALKKCGSPTCTIDSVMTNPGIYVLAASKNNTGARQYMLMSGMRDIAKAVNEAITACQKRTNYQCEIISSGAIPGEVKP